MMKNKVTAYDIPTFDCCSMANAGGADVTTVLHKFIIFFCITRDIYLQNDGTLSYFINHFSYFFHLSISAQTLYHLMMFVQIDENIKFQYNTQTIQIVILCNMRLNGTTFF